MPSLLYLLGLGVNPAEHATVEVLEAMGRCDLLYADGLDAQERRFLSRFCSGRLARVGKDADGVLAGKILGKLEAGKTVALATPGHPFYWSGLAGKLIGECERRKLAWRTFGSISPMGLAISAMGVTLGTGIYGLQSFDGAALAEHGAVLNPNWPLVVYFYSPLDRKGFERLAARLLSEYPGKHPVVWCSDSGRTKTTLLKELAGCFAEISRSTVLYVAERRPSRSRLGRTDSHPTKDKLKSAPAWVKE